MAVLTARACGHAPKAGIAGASMSVVLATAPAAAGKTRYCIERLRAFARERPLAPACICLRDAGQVRAFQQRLAAAGGALNVHVGEFYSLYEQILFAAGLAPLELGRIWQERLLSAEIERMAADGVLIHYRPLLDKPGWRDVLRALWRELQQAQVTPDALAAAVAVQGARLEELAELYARYRRRLQAEGWVDADGLGWLAVEALERQRSLAQIWDLVIVDGFDQLNPTQRFLLQALAVHAEVLITLTYGPRPNRLAHRRFAHTLADLQNDLGAIPQPLPVTAGGDLAWLEAGLFASADADAGGQDCPTDGAQRAAAGRVEFVEAPNRAQEVRAALRWVKRRVVMGGMRAGEVAVLARDLAPYQTWLAQVAEEYGLPLRLPDGQPLATNPAVNAVLKLMSLMRRDGTNSALEDGRLKVQPLLETLRSPYFDWEGLETVDGPLGLTSADVRRLEEAAARHHVIAGLQQWQEALAVPLARPESDEGVGSEEPGESTEELSVLRHLRACWERLVERLMPEPEATLPRHVARLEDLLGRDPAEPREAAAPTGLRLLDRVDDGPPAFHARDRAALAALRSALRDLTLAEEALYPGRSLTYERFVDEVHWAVQSRVYQADSGAQENAVWAGSVLQARGLTFRAVAILGLCEGVFPAAPGANPLLRMEDRQRLSALGLALTPEPAGSEFSLFYEAVTRARDQLLFARTYLTETGQPAEPSPFWLEALRLCGSGDGDAGQSRVHRARSADAAPLEEACSWSEWLQVLARQAAAGALGEADLPDQGRERWADVGEWAAVMAARLSPAAGPYEGDCSSLGALWAEHYPAERPWSASRLETYRGCPLAFFLGQALRLPERVTPEAGFDSAQLGAMYHGILEGVCRGAPTGELADQLEAQPRVAEAVLAAAPAKLGFRPTALWQQQRERLVAEVENTLRALAEMGGGWRPEALELGIGRPGDAQGPLPIATPSGARFWLRGVVDRVDVDALGRRRVIDYKSGSEAITPADLLEGRRLQLPLYAQALRALIDGPVVDGFYWHIRASKRSSLTLGGFEGGAEGASAVAAEHAWSAISGARAGKFTPSAQADGCPPYCPGAAFCWRYRPRAKFRT